MATTQAGGKDSRGRLAVKIQRIKERDREQRSGGGSRDGGSGEEGDGE